MSIMGVVMFGLMLVVEALEKASVGRGQLQQSSDLNKRIVINNIC